jgi:hypothetical protein
MPINKFRTQYTTGSNLYILLYNKDQEVAYPVGEEFETYGTSSRDASDYAISLSEITGTGFYYASWPSWVTAGNYDVIVRIQTGANPADSDTGYGPVEKYWTGSAIAEEPETNAVAICNQALVECGGGKDTETITALGDGTPTSDLCELIYTPVRKEMISRGYFEECIKYADCAESSFSGEMADWDYVFDLPSDYLKLIRQCHENSLETEYRSEVMQGYLFSNVYSNEDGDGAYIKYKWNNTDGSTFSQELVNCIKTKMAICMIPRLIKGEVGDKKRYYLQRDFENIIWPTNSGVSQSVQFNRDRFRHHWPILAGRSRKRL